MGPLARVPFHSGRGPTMSLHPLSARAGFGLGRRIAGGRRGKPGTPALHAGTRDPKRGTGRGGHAAVRSACHDCLRQGSSPFGASGMPSSSATFFEAR